MDKKFIELFCRHCPSGNKAHNVALVLIMFLERNHENTPAWVLEAMESDFAARGRFVQGFETDEAIIKGAAAYRLNKGPVEGQVTGSGSISARGMEQQAKGAAGYKFLRNTKGVCKKPCKPLSYL